MFAMQQYRKPQILCSCY